MAGSLLRDDADFVVVGSGAGGATAARWLAAAGASVVLVEEGDWPAVAPPDGHDVAAHYLGRGPASMATGGDNIAMLAGRMVGGSTALGYGVFARLPEKAYRDWGQLDPAWARRISYAELDGACDAIEAEWNVQRTPRELFGTAGLALSRAFAGRADPTWRAVVGCRGAGRCATGCPHKALQSADKVIVPIAQQLGVRLHSQCRVQKIDVKAGRAVGIRGRCADGRSFEFRCNKAVFLCGGAIGSTELLLRSGLPAAGHGLHVHVTATVAARMRAPCSVPVAGAAVQSQALRNEGTEITATVLPERMTAALLPGVGHSLEQRLAHLDHIATWSVSVRTQARGRVRTSLIGTRVDYPLAVVDRKRILSVLTQLSQVLFAQGAAEVFPQVAGVDDVLTNPSQCAAIATAPTEPGMLPLHAIHHFGGLHTDDRCQVPGIAGLVLADASALPASTGVPPQLTIASYAIAAVQRWV